MSRLSFHSNRSVPFGLAILIAIASLTGCATPQAKFTPLENPAAVPGEPALTQSLAINPADVIIYVTLKPDQPYRELGLLTYSTLTPDPTEEKALTAFRHKAATIGANGIILLPSREEPDSLTGRYYGPFYSNSNAVRTIFRAMAIQME
jgi:hypothetical protein